MEDSSMADSRPWKIHAQNNDRDKFLELIKPVKVIAKRRTGLVDNEMQMIEEKVNGLLTEDEDLK